MGSFGEYVLKIRTPVGNFLIWSLRCLGEFSAEQTSYLQKQKKLFLLGMKKEPKVTNFGLLSNEELLSLLLPHLTSLHFLVVPKRQMTNHPRYLFQMTAMMFRNLTNQINLNHWKTF